MHEDCCHQICCPAAHCLRYSVEHKKCLTKYKTLAASRHQAVPGFERSPSPAPARRPAAGGGRRGRPGRVCEAWAVLAGGARGRLGRRVLLWSAPRTRTASSPSCWPAPGPRCPAGQAACPRVFIMSEKRQRQAPGGAWLSISCGNTCQVAIPDASTARARCLECMRHDKDCRQTGEVCDSSLCQPRCATLMEDWRQHSPLPLQCEYSQQ